MRHLSSCILNEYNYCEPIVCETLLSKHAGGGGGGGHSFIFYAGCVDKNVNIICRTLFVILKVIVTLM